MKKVLIAGGTGFIGNALIKHLVDCGYTVSVLTRKKSCECIKNVEYYEWNLEREVIDKNAFTGVTIVINLTGANIGDKRWTKQRKREILDSRLKSANLLFKFIRENELGIDTFISSSAVGYYGAITSDELLSEESPNGKDFLALVCQSWEKAAIQFKRLNIRTVILRKGIIAGKGGGMYEKIAPLAKRGINSALGNGKHFLPWIDIRDLVRLYEFIISHNEISGIYNTVSSEHITMNEFSKRMLQSFGRKSFFPNVPGFIVKLLFGEMSEMLLQGSKVSNQKLINTGFTFQYDDIESSLRL